MRPCKSTFSQSKRAWRTRAHVQEFNAGGEIDSRTIKPMPTLFEWKRYWCPRDKSVSLSDRGFLADPDTEWGKLANADLVEFDKMAATSCLALLGEPGIGKTLALEREILTFEKPIVDAGGKLIRLDLRSFGSEDRLFNALFGSPEFEQWRNGNYVLHLFLDSLDECLLRIDNVAALLADELPKQPVERLRLRIACRTAPWPMILERSLLQLFGVNTFGAYELVPLRRKDVRLAAEQSGIERTDSFLDRIEDLSVTSLAIKPVTLNFLINTYLRDGDLPPNQIELYEKGCRILCGEPSVSRQGSGRIGRLTPEQRLAIASRIAGVTQFANKYAVWTGSEADRLPEEDVLIGELVGDKEFSPNEFTVSADSVREVLDTGLFSSRGQNRIGWAHQTYAEFLAARYCKRREMPISQLRNLIVHPALGAKRLVPQMREIAAWMSVMMPEVLEVVASTDPEALLGAAAASLSDRQRQLVVESILKHSQAGRLFHLRLGMYWLYGKLQHPQLLEQLRRYLADTSNTLATRHVAIDIGRACDAAELGPDLAHIAMNTSEDTSLRKSAAAAAASIGSAEVRRLLRPLAFEQAGPDPDDELKGAGLTALWPELISVAEILPLLTNPKNPQLSGLYTSFLASFPDKMSPTDLHAALDWFSKQPSRASMSFPLGQLMDKIILLAWANLDWPGIAGCLAGAILSRAVFYDELVSGTEGASFREELASDHEHRRRILEELLPRLGEVPEWGLYLAMRLINVSDFDWLLQRVLSGCFQSSALVDAKLVGLVTDSTNPNQMRSLWSACQLNENLNSQCRGFFMPVALDSDGARMARDNLRREQEKGKPKFLDPTPVQRIERDLHKIEHDQIMEGWYQLVFDMGLKPTSTRPSDEIESDLTTTPGWHTADASTRGRIVTAARRYVDEAEPQNDNWFHTSGTPYSALVGVPALALLLNVAEDNLQSVAINSWRKWIPALLRFPVYDWEKKKEKRLVKAALLQKAYSLVPEEVIERIQQEIDQNNEQHGAFLIATDIEGLLDSALGKALINKATDPVLKPPVVGALLQFLIRRNVTGSYELAESLITDEHHESRAIRAIQALIVETPDASWRKVWPIIRDNDKLGKLIIQAVSYGTFGELTFAGKLSESQLAELYLWMVRNYPYAEHSGLRAGAMGPVDMAVMLRDGILEHLKKRGSFEACKWLREVVEALPQYPGLRHQLEEAESLARAATWQPISARQFLTLAFDCGKRWVENGDQLVEVVLDSLDRLNSKLHAELTPVKYLWFPSGSGYKPRDEEDLSDYVAAHLNEDLRDRAVIVNREVQIRRGPRGSSQSTDIHVDAAVASARADGYQRLSLIIEVKGNWHDELLTAMRTQLRDRYLKDSRCLNGLYLVGWFSSPRWDEKDYRKREIPDMSLEDSRSFFLRQARDLSTDGYGIESYVLNLSLA